MDDLKTRLQAKADEMRLSPEMPTRLRKRARRRRVGNAFLASALVVALAAAAFVGADLLTDRPGPRPAAPLTDQTMPVWPTAGAGTAGDAAYIDSIQAQADQGSQLRYLEPEGVAGIFANQVMGWDLEDVDTSVRGDDPVQVVISNPALLERADVPGDVRTMLTMERWRGRDDGIFVITRATTDVLDLQTPQPGQDVSDAEELRFAGSVHVYGSGFEDLLTLTLNIEGAITNSSEGPGAFSFQPAAGQSEDGDFDMTVAMPDAPPTPGVSVLVQLREKKLAVEAFRLGPPEEIPPPHDSTTDEGHSTDTPTTADARRFVEDFMFARTMGTGDAASIWEYLAEEADREYRTDDIPVLRPCCGRPEDPYYADPQIVSVESADANSYEVVVQVTVEYPETGPEGLLVVRERLFVGPGTNVNGDTLPLVIRGVIAETPASATRDEIIAAARARDWEGLRALIPAKGFTFTFGGETDPIAFWQGFEGEGATVLDILDGLLSLEEPGELDGTFVWPAAATKDPSNWTNSDIEDMKTIYSERQIDDFREYGSYLGWRVGIEGDGTWVFFVAGD